MQILELNHVAIHVADVDASCQFYRDVLQLEPLPRPAFTFPGAWFRLGSRQELHIIGGRERDAVSGRRGNHYALLVDDLDAWESRLRERGIEYHGQIQRPDGARQIFFADPDGHTIELCTSPPSVT